MNGISLAPESSVSGFNNPITPEFTRNNKRQVQFFFNHSESTAWPYRKNIHSSNPTLHTNLLFPFSRPRIISPFFATPKILDFPMITRKLLPTQVFTNPAPYICRRCLHRNVAAQKIPSPTPFVPDHTIFLALIGRELSKHAPKFESWQHLFSLSSPQLRDLGIEPARTRRYLLRWREKFRNGEFGIGGDLKYVQDGVAELRVLEVPSLKKADPILSESASSGTGADASTSVTSGMTKLILNVPAGSTTYHLEDGQTTADLRKVKGVKLLQGHIISGPYVEVVKGTKGSVATLRVREGLWEHRRGHKVDGGERRKAEVRFKRGLEQRKKERS